VIVAEQNGDKIARNESTSRKPNSPRLAARPADFWRELPMRGRKIRNRSSRNAVSIVRRLLLARITDFRGLSHRDHTSLQARDLLAIRRQFGVQTEQRLMHLFEIVLSMSQRRFEADQSVFGRRECHGESRNREVDEGPAGSVHCDAAGYAIEWPRFRRSVRFKS
jgi:hypothetical protein